jgi:hypothetical protein
VALIVNGFVREVLQQLPMEFMAETQKLIGISLEGSVGWNASAERRSLGILKREIFEGIENKNLAGFGARPPAAGVRKWSSSRSCGLSGKRRLPVTITRRPTSRMLEIN